MRAKCWALILPLGLCLCSCSSNAIDPDAVRDAQGAYDEALEALEAHDYGLARRRLDTAIEGAGLRPDQYVDAYFQRTICLAQLGEFDAAEKDLEFLAQGAPEMERVHVARSFVLRKQGRQAEADAEMSRARAINATVQPIPD